MTNESTYRAWNLQDNGLKRVSQGLHDTYFVAVNLLGPRATTQRPPRRFWNDQLTIVQLRYAFMREVSTGSYTANASGVYGLTPLDIGSVYISFWDIVRHALARCATLFLCNLTRLLWCDA